MGLSLLMFACSGCFHIIVGLFVYSAAVLGSFVAGFRGVR